MSYRRAEDVDIKKLIEAITEGKIPDSRVALAEALGMSYNTLRKVIDDNPEVDKAMKLSREKIIDKSENILEDILDNESDTYSEKTVAETAKWVLERRDKRYKKDSSEDDKQVHITIEGFSGLKENDDV